MQKISFETLVKEYGPAVLNTAVRILGDAEKAQDVHQEVFLAIWRRWHKYDGRTKWRAYLCRATIRKAIDLAKRSRAESSMTNSASEPLTTELPDGALRTAELRRELAKCLAKLPKRQVEVFVLSRVEGLASDKVAEILGCSAGTVRVHLHRAMKRLARQLSGYFDEQVNHERP